MAKGVFNGRSVLVLDKKEGGSIYALGYYGRTLSVYKPKGREIESELELSPVEALYLARQGTLEVYFKGRKISNDELREILERDFIHFKELFMVYDDLKAKGYIVKPGMKFGADFAVYEHGPGIDHAIFLVHVVLAYDAFEPEEIVRAGRLSHGVRKRFVMAYPNVSSGKVEYVVFRWVKP
ncbi:MAG: tRNA-intron lyase [Thermoprotei archaeon]|jgi:tRNA-intron endonuclease